MPHIEKAVHRRAIQYVVLQPAPHGTDPAHVAEKIIYLNNNDRHAGYFFSHQALTPCFRFMPKTIGGLMARLSGRRFPAIKQPAQLTDAPLFQPVLAGIRVHGGWGIEEQKQTGRQAGFTMAGIAETSAMGWLFVATRSAAWFESS